MIPVLISSQKNSSRGGTDPILLGMFFLMALLRLNTTFKVIGHRLKPFLEGFAPELEDLDYGRP